MTRGVVTDDSVATGGLTELEINSLEVIVSLEEEEIKADSREEEEEGEEREDGDEITSGVNDVTSTGDADEVDEVEVTLSLVVKLATTEVGGSAIL